MLSKQQSQQQNKQSTYAIRRRRKQASPQEEDFVSTTRRAKQANSALSEADSALLQSTIGNQALMRVLQQNDSTSISSISRQPKSLFQSKSMIGQANVQREEASESPNTSMPLAINVQAVSAPHGSEQHSSNLTTTYQVKWSCFIKSDTLLFEYDNSRGHPATVTVVLEDDQGNGFLASGSISWTEGESQKKYLEFSGFPRRADGSSVMDSCDRTAILTNDANPGEGYEVSEKIY